jgi:YD repeat-containing protein
MPTRPSIRPVHPWGALLAAALAALLALPAASAQTTSETLDLIGPVAALEEYRWFPGTTERALFRTWAFDEAGVAIERVIFVYDWRDGSLRERRVTLFDAGQPLATVAYDADDEPTGQTVFRYDGEGRLVEEVTVDGRASRRGGSRTSTMPPATWCAWRSTGAGRSTAPWSAITTRTVRGSKSAASTARAA